MKRILLVGLILNGSISVKAQSFKEWFEQKKTKIEYLLNQVAALQVYTNTIEKGYGIVHEGLSSIEGIKKGDFSLHSEYFSSLQRVNPRVRSYWKIAAIIQGNVNIVNVYNKQIRWLHNSKAFTSDEVKYCSSVLADLLKGCSDIIDLLILVTTEGKLQMKDDERIGRIDQLYAQIKDRQEFIESFGRQLSQLAILRANDQNEVRVSGGLFGVQ